VQALAEAARGGRLPNRAAVCQRDGDDELSFIQQRSYDSWLAQPNGEGAPTDAQLRKDWARRNRLVASPAAGELQELQRSAKASATRKPDSQDARELCETSGNPQLAPSLLSDAPLPPRRQAPAPGKLPTLDPQGFYDGHAAFCSRCSATPPTPCYGPSMARLAGGIHWPWLGGSPPLPSQLRTSVEDPPYDKPLADTVTALMALGVLFEPADPSTIRHYSPVFLAKKVEIRLSPAEEAACAAGGAAAAHDVAAAKATSFSTAYASALEAAGWQPGRPAPPARVVSAAWDSAAETLGDSKGRFVIDMGHLTPFFENCSLRYGTLRSYTDDLQPGDWQIKLDMEKGFFNLFLGPEDSLYTGFKVNFGNRVASVCFARLPMGCHPAPHLFSCFTAEAKQQLVKMMRPAPADPSLLAAIMAYVDDFMAAARAADKDKANLALIYLRMIIAKMGGAVSDSKTSTEPAQAQVNLGVLVDTAAAGGVLISLPAPKAIKTRALAMVVCWAIDANTPIPERILGSLGGAVNWWASVDDDIVCHTPKLAHWAHAGHGRWSQWRSGTHKWGAEAPHYAKELGWLIGQARAGRLMCSRTQNAAAALARPSICFSVDASPHALCISSELGTLRVVLPDCGGLLIAIMELLSSVIILLQYGPALQGMLVDVASDALGACEWAMSRRSWRGEANDLFKLLGAATHKLDILFMQRWLTRWHNYRSDRGAALPLSQIPASVRVGLAAELTLAGLPTTFLLPLAEYCYPSIVFDIDAWSKINARK